MYSIKRTYIKRKEAIRTLEAYARQIVGFVSMNATLPIELRYFSGRTLKIVNLGTDIEEAYKKIDKIVKSQTHE